MSMILLSIYTPKCFQSITPVELILLNKAFKDQTVASVGTNTLFLQKTSLLCFLSSPATAYTRPLAAKPPEPQLMRSSM